MKLIGLFAKYALAILFWLALVSCQKEESYDGIDFALPVETVEVGVEDIEVLVKATGTLRAPEIIRLSVMTGGVLEIVSDKGRRLAEGDKVESGKVIANITGEDVRLASKRNLAEQKLKEAQKNLEAIEQLYKKNLVSDSSLEQAKTNFENAKLGYESSLHSENRNKIISPINGVILKLGRDRGQLMANGQLVAPGQVIAEVAALEKLIADVDVVGKDIAKVSSGLSARANYYAWQDKAFNAEVVRLSPTIDESTRSLRAEVEVDNSSLLLKPGMFVEVQIVSKVKSQVPVVPRKAVTQRGGRSVVFVVKGQRAELRNVELGYSNESNIEVIGGVDVGERIVITGAETLTDQVPVKLASTY